MYEALRGSLELLAAADLAAIAAWYNFSWPRSQWLGPALYRGESKRKIVSLTFDDGPHPEFTPLVLDVLRGEDVQATFFVCGSDVDANPEIARKIVDDGHMIGNHTYSHPYLYFQPRVEIRRQINLTQQAVHRATGEECRIFRPPYGARWVGLYPELKARDIELVAWSSWPETHSNSDQIVEHAIRDLRPGAVYLMHDGIQGSGGYFARKTNRPFSRDMYEHRIRQTVSALPGMISKIRERGYGFVTVGEMFALNNGSTIRIA